MDGGEALEQHLPRREPAPLADVGTGRDVDGHPRSVLRLGVACRERRGKAQRVARRPLEAFGIAYEHVRTGFGGHVQPDVAGFPELEGEPVIVRRGAPDEHGQAVR